MEKLMDRYFARDIGLGDINPIRAGYHKRPPGYYLESAVEDHWTLHYILTGRGIVYKDEKAFPVESAYCVVHRAGEKIVLETDDIKPWTHIWVCFQTSIPLPAILDQKDVFFAEELKPVFLSIANYNRSNSSSLEFFLALKIWNLIYHIENMGSAEIYTVKSNNYIDSACALIEKEYATITVDHLAKRLSLNRSYFSRLFKYFLEVSPHEYINTFRMHKSKELLLEGHSVSQVAEMTGYSSTPNFLRAFKDFYKYPPKQYLSLIGAVIR